MTAMEALDFFIRMMMSGIILGIINIAIFHFPKWE